ncbi:hypothetical protein CMV_028146 [Castanea mollissima]|uniref:GAG-pre-integrase domain-containing protein n=1 Tax=Castanea mollissima TaxID=60419 RepID=A0A8J4Q8B7_9ROSI|nr:hypothetical protein CMV_028146 [Castanea mollissima]
MVDETTLPLLVGIVVVDAVVVPHLIPPLGLILLGLPLELLGPHVKYATKWVTQPYNAITGSTMPIMDRVSRHILHRGPSKAGLYSFFPSSSRQHPYAAFVGERASLTAWHGRLGHLALRAVRQVLSKFQLPFVANKTSDVAYLPSSLPSILGSPPAPQSTATSSVSRSPPTLPCSSSSPPTQQLPLADSNPQAPPAPPQNIRPMQTRSKSNIFKPKHLSDGTV